MVWPYWMDSRKKLPIPPLFFLHLLCHNIPRLLLPYHTSAQHGSFDFDFCQMFIVINFIYSLIKIVVANVLSLSLYVSLLRLSYISMYDMFNQILLTLAILFRAIEIRRKSIFVLFLTFLKCLLPIFIDNLSYHIFRATYFSPT